MQPTRSILLAEEDATTRAFLADNLTADGYRVLQAKDARPRFRRSSAPSPTSSSATSTATRCACSTPSGKPAASRGADVARSLPRSTRARGPGCLGGGALSAVIPFDDRVLPVVGYRHRSR
jgi:hypothetical protein